ncbi:MAG: PaaI family thioesterase [Rubrivivax sp.]|nr:PaaI family thioesterase [Rubrivivax sp.]
MRPGAEVGIGGAGRTRDALACRLRISGFLHAGLIGALIDTACGFAAVTVAGPGVLAAHFSVNCLRPAQGERFIARARVVRAGRTQVFTACELFAVSAGVRKSWSLPVRPCSASRRLDPSLAVSRFARPSAVKAHLPGCRYAVNP